MYWKNKAVVVCWILIALLNSIYFDMKTIVIWFAAITIAMMQIEIIMHKKVLRYLKNYKR